MTNEKSHNSENQIVQQLLLQAKQGRIANRLRALDSLAKSCRPGIVDDFVNLLSDKSPAMRSAAAEYLGPIGRTAAIPPLIESLADSNREVRLMAARSLGLLLRGRRSPRPLINGLNDRDELVRIEVCESLGAIGDRKALPRLWRTIRDRSALVRSYAAGAIGELGGQRDIRKLEAVLQQERSEASKVGLYQALYVLGKTEALSGLISLLQSSDYRVRCAVANTLSNVIANESNARIILGALEKARRQESTPAAESSMKSSIRDIKKRIKNA